MSSLLCESKQTRATRNSLPNSQFDFEEKKYLCVRALGYKLRPWDCRSPWYTVSLSGSVKCVLADISDCLAALSSWLNSKHELKYVWCFVCLVPCSVGGSLCSSIRGRLELTAREKEALSKYSKRGKGGSGVLSWGGPRTCWECLRRSLVCASSMEPKGAVGKGSSLHILRDNCVNLKRAIV